jgi:hypothetical protein
VREQRDSTSFYIQSQGPSQSSLQAVRSGRLGSQRLQTYQIDDAKGGAGAVLVVSADVVVVVKLGEKVWESSGVREWGRGGGSG